MLIRSHVSGGLLRTRPCFVLPVSSSAWLIWNVLPPLSPEHLSPCPTHLCQTHLAPQHCWDLLSWRKRTGIPQAQVWITHSLQ